MSQVTPFVRPEATTWTVEDILRKAQDGQLYIPIFQRPFRWDADDVRKLFDSIYRGYPIGDLLLWETNETRGAKTSFDSVRFKPAKGNGYVIVDGQQRVTSLIAVLLANKDVAPQFRLFFDLEKSEFKHVRSRERIPGTYLPLPEVADTLRFLRWLQSQALPGDLVTTANLLVRALRDYRIPVYLVRTRDEQQIREIFERVNATGKSLNATEIFNALHRGREGTDLELLASRLGELGFGAIDESWLLKALAAVIGIDVTKNVGEDLRQRTANEIQSAVELTEESIHRVITFLQGDAFVMHIELLPHRFPLVPLTKLFHLIPEPSAASKQRLVAWLWKGAWSEQHSRSDAGTIKMALKDITENERSIVKLNSSTPKPNKPFELRPHDFRAAVTKVVCAVLASRQPRDLRTGELLDVPALLDAYGARAFQTIAIDSNAAFSGTENRILHPPIEGSVIDALMNAPEEALESHIIDRVTLAAYKLGGFTTFLAKRKELLEAAVREFLEERTISPKIELAKNGRRPTRAVLMQPANAKGSRKPSDRS